MIRLIRWLIFGEAHIHKWTTIENIDVYRPGTTLPTASKYVCRCDTCGKIKVYRT
jgi:hypothetical protein